MALNGNKRIVYEQLRRINGGCVSYGTLAILSGCARRTVLNVVHDLAARGLIHINYERGKPNRYKVV